MCLRFSVCQRSMGSLGYQGVRGRVSVCSIVSEVSHPGTRRERGRTCEWECMGVSLGERRVPSGSGVHDSGREGPVRRGPRRSVSGVSFWGHPGSRVDGVESLALVLDEVPGDGGHGFWKDLLFSSRCTWDSYRLSTTLPRHLGPD